MIRQFACFGLAGQCVPVTVVATLGIGFLLAVLWFDLMFDVQVRGHHDAELPPAVLDSLATYYRRVTTTARPMNRLIAAAMLVTVVGLVGEAVGSTVRDWVAWLSLGLTTAAVGLAAVRTVRNAVQLGGQADSIDRQSVLARSIFRDHVVCITAVAVTVVLQVVFAR